MFEEIYNFLSNKHPFKLFLFGFTLTVFVTSFFIDYSMIDHSMIDDSGSIFIPYLPYLLFFTLIIPSIIIWFTDFSRDVFKKKLPQLLIFCAFIPTISAPLFFNAATNGDESSFLYIVAFIIIAISALLFLFSYTTKYCEFILMVSYFLLLAFVLFLVYSFSLFLMIKPCIEDERMVVDNSFCKQITKPIQRR